MTYIPGDPWVICDLTGLKVRASQTRMTWDGYRVAEDVWYPKHPQLSVRAVKERPSVPDARPRQVDTFVSQAYPMGSFCLVSPNGTNWVVYARDYVQLATAQGTWGVPQAACALGSYEIVVSDVGVLSARLAASPSVLTNWQMYSNTGRAYLLFTDAASGWFSGWDYFDGGWFDDTNIYFRPLDAGWISLLSPSGYQYVLRATDAGAVEVVYGNWPAAGVFVLNSCGVTVDDAGVVTVAAALVPGLSEWQMKDSNGVAYRLVAEVGQPLGLSTSGFTPWTLWDNPWYNTFFQAGRW